MTPFVKMCNRESDINYHLPTLRYYTSQCKHVTEMGVRWICSTWAFLDGKPKTLRSYDLDHPEKYGQGEHLATCYEYAKENKIDFKFTQANVLEIEIDPTDLLFIDTWHIYDQLKQELAIHADKTKKYIILHDTETYGKKGEDQDYKGLKYAVNEFLVEKSDEWILHEHYTFCNGLTVLKRIK